MSDATTTLLGDWRPLDELAPDFGYKNSLAYRRWLEKMDVPLVPIRRVPHARLTDIHAALARHAERQTTPPRGPGRPRNTPLKAA
jgi:hypothetical protein